MLIRIGKWLGNLIEQAEEYIGEIETIEIKDEKYIDEENIETLISDLISELNRQIEKVEQMDQAIQNDYVRRRISRTEYGE